MTTLTEAYEESDHPEPSQAVYVAGRPVADCFNLRWSFEVGKAPTLTFSIPRPCPDYVARTAAVTVLAGYNDILTTVFSGKCASPVLYPDHVDVECVGQSWRLEVPFQRTISVSMVGDATTIVTNLVVAAGVPNYYVSLPTWSVGAAVPQTLEFQSYAEAVIKVALVDGSPWYEMPTGQVRVELKDPLPGPTAFRQYFSGQLTGMSEAQPAGVTNASARPRILDGVLRTMDREVSNWITVQGASVPTVESDGSTTSDVIETVSKAPSPFIESPPTYHSYGIANELIDTETKLAQVAQRYFALQNRLERRLELTVIGDPEVFLGATVEAIDPDYTGASGRWFVYGYSSSIDSGGFITRLDLRGGGPAGGGTGQLDPFACFHWTNTQLHNPTDDDGDGVEDGPVFGKVQQVVPAGTPGGPGDVGAGSPDGGLAVIVTFDASCSKDFDGSIASYAWSDDQGYSGTGVVWTHAYDPAAVSSIQVTLTVTDNDGNTDAITKTVNIKSDAVTPADPTVPDVNPDGSLNPDGGTLAVADIGVAAKTLAMDTGDGGATWADLSKAAGGAAGDYISVSGKNGTLCFGTASGEIIRSTDGCATGTKVYTASGAPRIECVWADTELANIWWAGSADGRIFHSADDGVTWGLYVDFGDGFPIYALATPDAGTYRGWLFAFGGDASDTTTLVRYDANKTGAWASAPISGDLATACGTAGAGAVRAAASAESMDLALLFNTTVVPRHWYAADWTTGTYTAAVGLPAATDGKALAPGYNGAGDLLAVMADGKAYSASDGINFGAGVATPSQVNHLFWEPGVFGVYVGAADGGVVKTLDHGATWGYVRPNVGAGTTWPAGAVGYQVTFEAATQSSAPGDLYVVTEGAKYYRLAGGTGWTEKNGAAPATACALSKWSRDGTMYHLDGWSTYRPEGSFYYSGDWGETWALRAPPVAGYVCVDYDVSPDGTVWALWREAGGAPHVYSSPDGGASWTEEGNRTGEHALMPLFQYDNLDCSQVDGNKVVYGTSYISGHLPAVFTDGQAHAGWTQTGTLGQWFRTKDPPGGAAAGSQQFVWWGKGQRLIWVYGNTGGAAAYVRVNDLLGTDPPGWVTKLTTNAAFDPAGPLLIKGGIGASALRFLTFVTVDPTDNLWRTVDDGDTWTQLSNPAGLGATAKPRAMTYDILLDRLYVSFDANSGIYYLTNASSVAAGSEDWTALPTLPGADTVAPRGMCLLYQ